MKRRKMPIEPLKVCKIPASQARILVCWYRSQETEQSAPRMSEFKILPATRLLVGLFLGAIGAFIGFLVGTGRIALPGLEPGAIDPNPAFLFASVVAGLVGGGLTGIILGVASKLLRSQEKAEVVTRKIKQGGVLITVNVDDSQSASKAHHVMEEQGAIDVGNPSEKWDLNAWINPNENPSLANAR